MLFAAYIRVSTADQAETRLGLDAQRQAILRYIALVAPGATVSWFADEASAAAGVDRPGLASFTADVTRFAALVVLRLDRLQRSLLELLKTIVWLDDNDVTLHSVSEHIDTSGPVGRLSVSMLGAIAEFERDMIRTRTREALAVKRARGEHLGRPPFGFAARPFRIDPATIATPLAVFELRAQRKPLRYIATRLGLPLSTVRGILANPIYQRLGLL